MTDNPQTQSEVSPKSARYWISEIEAAKERLREWYKKADDAEKRYRDEDCGQKDFGSLNILAANVEVQKAAIGEDFGSPQVTRLNMPEDDGGLARQVALVWEKTISASVSDANDNHDIALAVADTFVPGRGQIWLEVEQDERGWVSAPLVRVMYDAYLEGPATRWGSVPWVARQHLFTRDELISECNMDEEKAAKVNLSIKLPHSKDKEDGLDEKGKEQFKRAEVWEIWSKYPQKSRIYVAIGHKDEVLRYDADPLRLKHFFPCPRPLLLNGDESKPPLTDYSRYQAQAEELDRICQRIYSLTEQLRRVGFHDKEIQELADLATAEDGTSIPVENWAGFSQKGQLLGVQVWLDLVPIINVLVELHKQRDTLIRLIFELSGISDLARGHTDPDETATAQQLKQTFGSSRFKRREKESRRFAAEGYALKGEVIAELFSREQIEMMSGIRLPLRQEIDGAKAELQRIQTEFQAAMQQYQAIAQEAQQQGMQPPPQPMPPDQEAMAKLGKLAGTKWSWEDISGVLRSDERRCYMVEVETDQSNFTDESAEQAARTAFFSAFMQALQQIAPMISANPKNGEVFKQLVMFVIGAFKTGRAMEEGIERVIDEGIQRAMEQSQQQQPPAPEVIVAQAKVKTAEIGLQSAQVKLQTEQVRAMGAAQKMQQDGAATQAKAAESAAKSQASITASAAKAQDAQTKSMQEAQKVQQQAMANEAKRAGHVIDMVNKKEKLDFDRETRATAEEALLKGETRKPSGD